jgi:serine/threonine-protein kinase HipA
MDDNTLDFDLARSVGDFFRLSLSQMDEIIKEVMKSVNQWKEIADKIEISKREQEMLKEVFFTGVSS